MSTKIAPAVGAGVFGTQEGTGSAPGYSAMDVRRAFGELVPTSCVVGSGSFKVEEHAGANMTVNITQSGSACVIGTTVAQQGVYAVQPHKEVINETIEPANATNPRIDQVVLRVFDNVLDSSGKNEAVVEVLTGTPTAGATLANKIGAAARPATSLVLAYVLVPAKAVSITAADIENVAPVITNGATYLEGTAAARPNASVKGRIYYATDTKAYSADNGTAWNSLGLVTQEAGAPQSFLSWGMVAENGTVEAGTGDYTVAKTGTGLYEVTWNVAKSSAKYAVVPSTRFILATQRFADVNSQTTGHFIISTLEGTSTTQVNSPFEFIVMAGS